MMTAVFKVRPHSLNVSLYAGVKKRGKRQDIKMVATGVSKTTNTQLSATWVAVSRRTLIFTAGPTSHGFHRCFRELLKASLELPIACFPLKEFL